MTEIKQPKGQLFNENFRSQPIITEIIIDWAKDLPSPKRVIDLAAGFAIEGFILQQQAGIPTISIDASPNMISHGYDHHHKLVAEAQKPPFPKGSFEGALLKDSLVFLLPEQREIMLQSIRPMLTSGGSLLVISELINDYSISYRPKSLHDLQDKMIHLKTKEIFETTWRQFIKDEIPILQFHAPVSINDFFKQADTNGYGFQLLEDYDAGDSLAYENRWTDNPGFVAVLTKK